MNEEKWWKRITDKRNKMMKENKRGWKKSDETKDKRGRNDNDEVRIKDEGRRMMIEEFLQIDKNSTQVRVWERVGWGSGKQNKYLLNIVSTIQGYGCEGTELESNLQVRSREKALPMPPSGVNKCRNINLSKSILRFLANIYGDNTHGIGLHLQKSR